MQAQTSLRNLSPALSEMTTKRRPEYERALRGVRWGQSPVYVLASARERPAGLMARYALEELLGYPVVAREAWSFLTYSLHTLRPGAIVILIDGEAPEVLEAAQAARKRGAQVLAVAPESAPLAQAADQVFALPSLQGPEVEAHTGGPAAACLEHAALGYLAFLAARLFKRPHPLHERLEEDWRRLPDQLNWMVGQLADAVRSFAAELRQARHRFFVGGGFYHAAALGAADFASRREGTPALGIDLAGLRLGWLHAIGPGTVTLFLSGSRGRSAKAAASLASDARLHGAAALAMTDTNDHDLIREARLTLLLPDLAELPGSILALALAGWVARESAEQPQDAFPARSRSASVPEGSEQAG